MPYCFNDNKSKAEFNQVAYDWQTIKGNTLTIGGHSSTRVTLPVNSSTNGIPIGVMGINTRNVNSNTSGVCPVHVIGFNVNVNNIVVDLYNSASGYVSCSLNVILSTLDSVIGD